MERRRRRPKDKLAHIDGLFRELSSSGDEEVKSKARSQNRNRKKSKAKSAVRKQLQQENEVLKKAMN